MRAAGEELHATYGAAFLIKGGHLREKEALDLLFAGDRVTEFRAPFVDGVSTHGTGCTYAAAITASLAKGMPLETAVQEGKTFVTSAIRQFLRWERPEGPTDALHHWAAR
jgi:hydroxymethylpyrimidine/phosphomethylpyrimidine kinase